MQKSHNLPYKPTAMKGGHFFQEARSLASIADCMCRFDIVFGMRPLPCQWYYMVKVEFTWAFLDSRVNGHSTEIALVSIALEDTRIVNHISLSGVFQATMPEKRRLILTGLAEITQTIQLTRILIELTQRFFYLALRTFLRDDKQGLLDIAGMRLEVVYALSSTLPTCRMIAILFVRAWAKSFERLFFVTANANQVALRYTVHDKGHSLSGSGCFSNAERLHVLPLHYTINPPGKQVYMELLNRKKIRLYDTREAAEARRAAA